VTTAPGEKPHPKTTIFAWGANGSGQLGNTDFENNVRLPTAVFELDDEIVAIEAGTHSVYAICADGTVYAWGENADGQLGDGTRVSRPTPKKIPGLTDVVAIAAWDAAYALKSDGTVWTWGIHSAHQIRNPRLAVEIVGRLRPVRIGALSDIVGVAASARAGFALRRDGRIHSWGGFEHGELGSSPMNVEDDFYPSSVQRANSGGGKQDTAGLTGLELLIASYGTVESEPIRDASAVTAGFLSAYALASDGTVWSWGHNDFGQLGWGDLSDARAIDRIKWELAHGVTFPKWPAADKVRNLSNVVALASKGLTAYALRRDGTVWAWGANDLGQLGQGSISPQQADGTLDHSITAKQVPNLKSVVSIAAMGDTAYAVHNDGRVSAWGDNRNNEVGDGETGVEAQPKLVRGLEGVSRVAAGVDFAVAVVPVRRPAGGCYVATAVYGSYDAPPVVTLRRFRDQQLAVTTAGRVFIRIYYALSPSIARKLRSFPLINRAVRRALDGLVARLEAKTARE